MLETKEDIFLEKLHTLFHEGKNAPWDLFLQKGLPSKKTPSYQYVGLKDLYAFPFAAPQKTEPKLEKLPSGLVFYNGNYQPSLSLAPKGIIVLPFSEALKTYANFLLPRMKKIGGEEKDPFALLSVAHDQEGLFLYIPPKTGCEEPLQIVHIIDQPYVFASPRLHVFGSRDSHVKIHFHQKRQSKETISNVFFDYTLDERAKIEMVLLEEKSEESINLHAIRAVLKEKSNFSVFSATSGGKVSRHDYSIYFAGEGGESSLSGVWKLKNQCEHHVHVLMHHEKPNCHSLQHFKGVNYDFAKSSFEGKIYVGKEAIHTNAYQRNHNLILGERAFAYAKPNLEIFADDVKASHGATVGKIKEEDLFYLKSRGISETSARHLLVQGFLEEILPKALPMQARDSIYEILS